MAKLPVEHVFISCDEASEISVANWERLLHDGQTYSISSSACVLLPRKVTPTQRSSPMAHRFSVSRHTAQTIAETILLRYYNEETGWSSLAGGAWEGIYKKLRTLPAAAKESEVLCTSGGLYTYQLDELFCACCKLPNLTLVNLGAPSATFWVCEGCLVDGQRALAGVF